MHVRKHIMVGAIVAVAAVAGCSSGATAAPPTAAPASAAAASGASGGGVVEAKAVGSFASIVVAAQGAKDNLGEDKSGFTLYYFTKDASGGGASACTGKCYSIWPALVVPDGTTPTAGAGVSGTLGTIKRADDGKLQVTLNGQPLYYFSKDTAPGQTNGYYPGWGVVNADGTLIAPPSAPPASAAASGSAPAPAGSPASSSSSKY